MQVTDRDFAHSLHAEKVRLQGDSASGTGMEPVTLNEQFCLTANGKHMSRILVVEDSPTQARQLQCILEGEGYEVEVAPDGGQGFRLLDASPFDLVISDILMPGLCGYELCRKIKDDPAKRNVSVILLTSLTDPLDIIQGLESGADNFITKPYEPDYLLGRVKTILDNKALRKNGKLKVGVEVVFLGKKLTINSDKEQILDLLVATFEDVVRTNRELRERQRESTQRTQEMTRSEQTLRDQTAILKSILGSMGDGVVVADENGRFTHFNPAAEKILGVGQTDAAPPEWAERYGVFLPDTVTPCPTDKLPLVRAIRGEEVNQVELFIRNDKLPHGIWLSVTGRPLKDESGASKGGVVVFQDVTARKQAEQRALEATAQLEAANRELEAFSYSVSHDLRAPLRAIDGFSRILLEEHGSTLSDEAQEYLKLVRDNTQQMGQLVDDLLNFSRLSRQQVKKQTVAPAKIVRQCLEELRREQEARSIQITVDGLPNCKADPSLLKQVWFNLLSNALKYTRNREAALIEVGCCQGNRPGERTYFVKDNGVGFDMQYAPKLFGVFQRLHRAEDYEGTGVGLAIVQRIILHHGGRVWAEAQPDQGATFYFTLEGASPCP